MSVSTVYIHPFIGQHVLVRTQYAGVHMGTLVVYTPDYSIITDALRLWRWQAVDGIALSGVARFGLVPGKSKIDSKLGAIALAGVIELIPTTDEAQLTFAGFK